MWCRSYRDHVIMAFPSFDTATNLWAPQASISWVVGAKRKSEFVRFAKRVFTESAAAASALSAGQSWVDLRLKGLADGAAFASDKEANSAQAFDAHFFKGDRATAKKILTFDQFKSWVDQSDPNVSEQLLQKSYAALVRLRKHQHCSWAHIIVKMKNSQAQMAPSASVQNAKSSHLPLTLRDWRRII